MPRIKRLTTEQWLEQRKLGIGASDIGPVAGLSKWKSPRDIFNLKLGLVEPDPENGNMRWGTQLEGFLQDEFERNHPGMKVQKDNFIRIHPVYPWAICSLDRMIIGEDTPGVLELKTTTSFAMKFWETEVPLEYFAQVQWQLFVTGYTWGYLFLGILDKRDVWEMRIERDDKFIAMLLEKAVEFQAAVEAKDPAGLLLTVEDTEKLKPIEGKSKTATDEIKKLVDTIIEVSGTKSTAEKSEKELKGRLKLFMEDAEFLVDGEVVMATYKDVPKAAFTVPAKVIRTLNVVRSKKEKA